MPDEILIVDDERDIRALIAGILEDEGYLTRQAATAEEALEALSGRRPSLAILDVWLEGSRLDGLELLGAIRRDWPGVPVVLISGHGTIETAVAALRHGAWDFIEKPFKTDRLLITLRRALEAARFERELAELRFRGGSLIDLIGTSPAINQIRQAIERVAPTNSRVLLSGSPGTGKEVVARLIHKRSRRAEGPFVVLNCALMHPDRLEAELLGEEQANGSRRIGMLEQAHGGTLLLDEVADMPLATQGKIVRILHEQTFERLGGTARIDVDVRVLAATNRDLAAEIASGRFRRDLYYRLNVVPLELPRLAERREDIPLLIEHFLRLNAEAGGMRPHSLSDDALAALQGYDWPGNVRQLRNMVEWLLIMAGDHDGPIRADLLPPEVAGGVPRSVLQDQGGELMALPLREARERFERAYLIAQVNRFGGNISRTASFIGMERSALHRKLKALGVSGNDRSDGDDEFDTFRRRSP